MPSANSSLLLIMDEMPTNISGKDVPRATTLRPIIKSLIPTFPAIDEALSINLLAPHMSKVKDKISHKMLVNSSIQLFYIGMVCHTLIYKFFIPIKLNYIFKKVI